jgi:hypothetical protein
LLKTTILVLLLVMFACIGIAHVITPDLFIQRSGVRKGGELLTWWNRIQFRGAGAVLAAFAFYMLYVLFRG